MFTGALAERRLSPACWGLSRDLGDAMAVFPSIASGLGEEHPEDGVEGRLVTGVAGCEGEVVEVEVEVERVGFLVAYPAESKVTETRYQEARQKNPAAEIDQMAVVNTEGGKTRNAGEVGSLWKVSSGSEGRSVSVQKWDPRSHSVELDERRPWYARHPMALMEVNDLLVMKSIELSIPLPEIPGDPVLVDQL